MLEFAVASIKADRFPLIIAAIEAVILLALYLVYNP